MIKQSYLTLAIAVALSASPAITIASEAQNDIEQYAASNQDVQIQPMWMYVGTHDTRTLGRESEVTLKGGEGLIQELVVNGNVPGQSEFTAEYFMIDGFHRWSPDRDASVRLVVTDQDSQEIVYSGTPKFSDLYTTSFRLKIPQPGVTRPTVAKLEEGVRLEYGKRYQVAFHLDNESQQLTFNPIEYSQGASTAKRVIAPGEEEDLGHAMFMRFYGESTATDFGVGIKSAINNKFVFDPGYALPFPEKLLDPSSKTPEQLIFDMSALSEKHITFSVVNEEIASIKVEKAGDIATLEIYALNEGETYLHVKAGGELVATVGLHAYSSVDIPVSFREVKMPGLPITLSRYDEVAEYLRELYKPLNINLAFNYLGVEEFDWQSNGNTGYVIPPPEGNEKYFSNLYIFGDDHEGNLMPCRGGNGSSGSYEQSHYGFKGVSRYCNTNAAIATLAHELGHNLSLSHYSSQQGSADALLPNEYLNLMKTGRDDTKVFGFQWRIVHQKLQQLIAQGSLPSIPSDTESNFPERPPEYSAAYVKNQLVTEIPILPKSIKSDWYQIEIIEWPEAGVAVPNPNGTLSYRHLSDDILSDQIVYRLVDQRGQTSNNIVLSITIENETTSTGWAGYRGVGNSDQVLLASNGPTIVDLMENDTLFHASAVPDLGYHHNKLFMFNDDGTATIDYDTWIEFNKVEKIGYRLDYVNTPEVDRVASTNIYIEEANPEGPAATANDGQIKVNFGQSTLISPSANDIDNGAGLNHQGVNIRQHPAHGLIEVNEQGQLLYRHDGSDATTDSFTYRVKDSYGRLSNLASVTLNIETEREPDDFTIVWPSLEKSYSMTDAEGVYVPLALGIEDGDSDVYSFVATVDNVSSDSDEKYKVKGKVGEHTPNLHITEPGTYKVVVRVVNEFGDKEKKAFKFKVTDEVVEDFDIHWEGLEATYQIDNDGLVIIPLSLSVENGTSDEYTFTATTSDAETGDNVDTQQGVIGAEVNKYITIEQAGDYQADVIVKNASGDAETETYFFSVKEKEIKGQTLVKPLKDVYTLTDINDYPWLVVPVTLTGYADNINTHVGIFKESGEGRVAYSNVLLDKDQTLVLDVKGPGVTEGYYTVKVWTNDNDPQSFPIYVENAEVEEEFDFVYPDGLGSYLARTKVQAADGGIYQCKPYPATGWCNVDSAAHYAPGVGSHWEDAWTKVTAGDGNKPESGDHPNYAVGNVYVSGDKVSHLQRNFECKVSGWCSSPEASSWAYEPGVGLYWEQAWAELTK